MYEKSNFLFTFPPKIWKKTLTERSIAQSAKHQESTCKIHLSFIKVAQSQKVICLWTHCLKKMPNHSPDQQDFWILSIKENKQLTQKSTLARFIGNGTKVKLPSEIKPTLVSALGIYNFAGLKAIPCLSALLSSCILTYFSKSTEAGSI